MNHIATCEHGDQSAPKPLLPSETGSIQEPEGQVEVSQDMGQIGVLEAPENNHAGSVWFGEAVQKDGK